MAVPTRVHPSAASATIRSDPTAPIVAWAGAIGMIAMLLRLVGRGRALDIFVDEPLYVALGHSVRSGWFPMVDGSRFFLHPPGFFYLESGWERLFGYRPDVVGGVYEMRGLNAVLAGGTAFALVVLVARAGSVRPAVAAGTIFAIEPFCIRQNGRVLLETALMFWVVAGYAVLLPLTRRELSKPLRGADVRGRARRSLRAVLGSREVVTVRARAVCAGILFGLAVLTKDEAALITVVPLLVAAALRWGPRRLMLLSAGVATLTYLCYVAAVTLAGYWAEYWAAKDSGGLRFLGFRQITGFNAPDAPSLGGRLVQESMYFGTTYTLLAVSPLALALLVRRGDASQRLVGLFYASAVAVLAYAGLVGTLEEQALYLMLVPALGALGAAASLLTGRQALRLSLFSLLLMVNLATYLQWRLRPDDGFVQLRHYMAAHVPAGSAVITSGDVKENLGGSFRVLAGRYRIVRWVSRQDAVSQNARYLIVPWKDVSDGYSYLSVSRVRSLTNKAVALFSFHGRTYTNLVLYRLPLPARPHAGGRG